MRKFLDNLSVFVACALKLQLTSWPKAQRTAARMRADHSAFVPSQVEIDGEMVDVKAPPSPVELLRDSAVDAAGFIVMTWILFKIVTGFLVALPYLISIALVVWVISMFPKAKGQAQVV